MLTTGGWETDLPLLVCVHTVCVCRCCQEILPVSNVPNPGPLAPPCPSPSTQASSLRSLQGGGSREWMGGGSAPYCCPTGDSSAPSTSVRHLCDRRGSVCPTVPPHPCHRLGVEARTQGPWARSPLGSGTLGGPLAPGSLVITTVLGLSVLSVLRWALRCVCSFRCQKVLSAISKAGD